MRFRVILELNRESSCGSITYELMDNSLAGAVKRVLKQVEEFGPGDLTSVDVSIIEEHNEKER